MQPTKVDRNNIMRVNLACLAWVLSWLGLKSLMDFEIIGPGPLAAALSLIPLGLGVAMILIYRRFLREADEMLRIIQLEALAFAVGGTLVGVVAYSLLEQAGMVPAAGISNASFITCVCYMIGVIAGNRRFQ